jgi:hypothetical protein
MGRILEVKKSTAERYHLLIDKASGITIGKIFSPCVAFALRDLYNAFEKIDVQELFLELEMLRAENHLLLAALRKTEQELEDQESCPLRASQEDWAPEAACRQIHRRGGR